jgi:hypothetical protein
MQKRKLIPIMMVLAANGTFLSAQTGAVTGVLTAAEIHRQDELKCQQQFRRIVGLGPLEAAVAVKAAEDARRCRESGAEVLTALWKRAPATDPPTLRNLRSQSLHLRDERLFSTMLTIFTDRKQHRDVRLAALTVAGHAAEPGVVRTFDNIEALGYRLDDGELVFVDIGSHTVPGGAIDGTQPVGVNAKARLVGALETVQKRPGEDEYVVVASRQVLRSLAPK